MKKCIVLLSFNHPEITKRALLSALKFNLPIILVHNGSMLKHVENIKSSVLDSKIIHLVFEHNTGFSGGANRGLHYAFNIAEFDWALFITNDIELINFPEFDLVPGLYAPLIYFRKTDKIDSIGGFFDPKFGKLSHNKSKNIDLARKFFYIPGTSFLIHRSIFLNVGGFDETLHTYWEDVDFSVRAYLKNQKLGIATEIQLLHRVGKTCHDNPMYTTYFYQRNRKKISLRYGNFIQKTIFLVRLGFDFFDQVKKLLHTKNQSRFILFIKAIRD